MDRQTALKRAGEIMAKMQGLKKNREYRVIQNDLLALADALQVAAQGWSD